MPATLSLSSWASLVNGQSIGSGECVALANDYCARVLGLAAPATAGGAHDPYASSMWEGLPAGAPYRKVSPLAPMMPGDLIIWKYGSGVAPLSHVAVGLTDLGGAVLCMSQNTNGHRYAEKTTLPKAGIYGYLRPVSGGSGAVLASDLGGFGHWYQDAFGAAGSVAAGVAGPGGIADTWGKILGKLSDPAFWQRIGIGLLGTILIMLVLFKILESSGAVPSVTGLIKKAV